jgi:Pyruvate/2-oxoacid:ferredoxin oxidoreductase delta subunit
MSQNGLHFHYVCTHEEALDLIQQRESFWISNCGCREERGNQCRRSRQDVCLQFSEATAASGSARRAVSKAEVITLLQEATSKQLVARPFRKEGDFSVTDGICFCCDDCCGYFLNPEEECDKGAFIEKTDLEACTHCGLCEDICHFAARTMVNSELSLNRENCYGCGLCVTVCPEACVQMVARN